MALDDYLNTASIILLLISPDFIADYWREIQRAMERHVENEAWIIPVLLRPIDRQGAPFEKLQALPSNGIPVESWPNRDEAFADIARDIRTVLENIQNLTMGSIPSTVSPHQNKKREESAKSTGNSAIDLYRLASLYQCIGDSSYGCGIERYSTACKNHQ